MIHPDLYFSRGIPDETPEDEAAHRQVETTAISAAVIASRLPPLNLPLEKSHAYDFHHSTLDDSLDLSALVKTRRAHETKRAATGVRTHFRSDGHELGGSADQTAEVPIRRRIFRKMNAILKEEQDRRANTGGVRKALWTNSAPGGRSEEQVADLTGNSANAELSAGQRALKVRHSKAPSTHSI